MKPTSPAGLTDQSLPAMGPLHGITVIDFTQMMAGPLCTMLLGDLGAAVIKVEPPTGDPIRRTGDTRIGGETEYTLSLNRNKRSIALDLKTPEGLRAALKIADQCDIAVENFRPGTADRLGIGWRPCTHAIHASSIARCPDSETMGRIATARRSTRSSRRCPASCS